MFFLIIVKIFKSDYCEQPGLFRNLVLLMDYFLYVPILHKERRPVHNDHWTGFGSSRQIDGRMKRKVSRKRRV